MTDDHRSRDEEQRHELVMLLAHGDHDARFIPSYAPAFVLIARLAVRRWLRVIQRRFPVLYTMYGSAALVIIGIFVAWGAIAAWPGPLKPHVDNAGNASAGKSAVLSKRTKIPVPRTTSSRGRHNAPAETSAHHVTTVMAAVPAVPRSVSGGKHRAVETPLTPEPGTVAVSVAAETVLDASASLNVDALSSSGEGPLVSAEVALRGQDVLSLRI